jgi:hypothetical protein
LRIAVAKGPKLPRNRRHPLRALRRLVGRVLGRSSAGAGVTPYPEWLANRIAERGASYPVEGPPVTFSVMTTVYEKTDAVLLKETERSLAAQSFPFHEWIILAHGPISAELNALLQKLAQSDRIRVHRLPDNLGIAGGMRFCLEAAQGEYVVPMDADDVLTADALQILASVAGAGREHAFLYSDEDNLVDGVPGSPYWRPDWDPVLNLESSYIWHLCAFRRDVALQLGVYTDAGCNWCHDWDTVARFADAGHTPKHVREILYHWRHHSLSSTNRAAPHQGSLDSTRHFLERRISRTGRPQLYYVDQFPIFRGSPEWHIARHHEDPVSMDLVLVARRLDRALLTLGSMEEYLNYPIQSVTLCLPKEHARNFRPVLEQYARALLEKSSSQADVRWVEGSDCAGIASAVRGCTSRLLWLGSDAIELLDGKAPWEALRLMELHADIKMVCGILMDGTGRIVDAGSVLSSSGHPVYPYLGWPAPATGPYVLALKPHSVSAPTTDLLIAEREFILASFEQIPMWATPSGLAMWLGGCALAAGARTAFSPLVRGVAKGPLFSAGGGAFAVSERERDIFLARYGGFIGTHKLSFSRHFEMCRQYAD